MQRGEKELIRDARRDCSTRFCLHTFFAPWQDQGSQLAGWSQATSVYLGTAQVRSMVRLNINSQLAVELASWQSNYFVQKKREERRRGEEEKANEEAYKDDYFRLIVSLSSCHSNRSLIDSSGERRLLIRPADYQRTSECKIDVWEAFVSLYTSTTNITLVLYCTLLVVSIVVRVVKCEPS